MKTKAKTSGSKPRQRTDPRRVLVTGATGFVGRALVPALLAEGHAVRAVTRAEREDAEPRVEWLEADVMRPETLAGALDGVDAAYWLVHGMASGAEDFAEEERFAAAAFAREAARAGVRRIVYLGGVAPRGEPSKHLASRLAVGAILRGGRVPAIELRASMIIGPDGASWRVVRDLALRLPAMILPAWSETRTCPIALEDTVRALVDAVSVPLEESAWFDLPGPEVLSIREILQRVAALRGRRIPTLRTPLPTPRLSTLWLKLVSDGDIRVVRELVMGLAHDLLPEDERWYALTEHPPRIPFDEAARRALAADLPGPGLRGMVTAVEEALVERFGPRLPT
jgi:uncharacterized protein YbjT (DUF2867 family)